MAKNAPDPGGDGNGPMFLVRGRTKKAASPKKPKRKTGKVKAAGKNTKPAARKGGDGDGPLI